MTARTLNRPATVLDFERPLIELELRVARLQALGDPALAETAAGLEQTVRRLRDETFARLTRWQIVELARHPGRPSPLDYIEGLCPDFLELHGDRARADDPAVVGGVGTVGGRGGGGGGGNGGGAGVRRRRACAWAR